MENNAKFEQLHFESDIHTTGCSKYPAAFPLHWHQYVECIAAVGPNSQVLVMLNQKPITLKTGDILFILPGELHEIIDNHSKSIIALQFPVSLISSKKEFADFYDSFRDNGFLSYEKSPELNKALLSNFARLMEISEDQTDAFRNIHMTIVLYEIFIKTITHLRAENGNNNASLSTNLQLTEKIQLACSYIKTHCEEPLSLNQIADLFGFSACYFSRHFKAITTHSFVEYLTIQRINRMQELLGDKNYSVTEAAYLAGFKSISTLNRTFSRYCGCSPSEYRKYYSS